MDKSFEEYFKQKLSIAVNQEISAEYTKKNRCNC